MMRDYLLRQVGKLEELIWTHSEAIRLLTKIKDDIHWCRRSDIAREITAYLKKQKEHNE